MEICAGNYQHNCSQPPIVTGRSLGDLLNIALILASVTRLPRGCIRGLEKKLSAALIGQFCPAMRLKCADNLLLSKCTVLGDELERFNSQLGNRVAYY